MISGIRMRIFERANAINFARISGVDLGNKHYKIKNSKRCKMPRETILFYPPPQKKIKENSHGSSNKIKDKSV